MRKSKYHSHTQILTNKKSEKIKINVLMTLLRRKWTTYKNKWIGKQKDENFKQKSFDIIETKQ